MRINKLRVTNFKSFPKLTEFDLTYGGDNKKKVTLIGGMNGAGKSSFMEALGICLYGKSKSEIIKVINKNELKNGNSKMTIELEFETDDGDIFIIKRYWFTNKAFGEIKANDLDESITVTKNGEIVQFSIDTWQEFIESTIPLGIIKFFFFDGEQVSQLSETENEGLQLKTDLESVLGIGIVRRLIEDLQKIQSDIARENNSNSVSSAELTKVESDINYANEKIEELKNEKSERELDIADNHNKINELDVKINKILGFNPELIEEKSELNSRLTQINTNILNINKNIDRYCSDVLPVLLLSKYFSLINSQYKNEEETVNNKTLIESSENIASKVIEQAIIPQIPNLDNTKQNFIKSKIIEILTDGKNEEKEIILNISSKEFADTTGIMKSAEADISNLSVLISEKENLLTEKKEIEIELEKVELPADKFLTYKEIEKNKNELVSENGRFLERISKISDEIFQQNIEKENNQERQRKLITQFQGSQGERVKMQKYEDIIKSLEKYVELLKSDKLHDLEKYILQMYKKLASKRELVNRVTVDEDTYEIVVWKENNQRLDRDSAGEKEVFTISMLWGLSQCTDFRLPVIIDTPLARLDSSHRSQIVGEYFPNASNQVIILSTDKEIEPNSQYYEIIKPFVNKEITIEFDVKTESSSVKNGYFIGH
jgi:DNA sulfur modification protein DndD